MKPNSLFVTLSVFLAVGMLLSACTPATQAATQPATSQPAATKAATEAPTKAPATGEKTTIKVMSFFAYDTPAVEYGVVSAFEQANPDIVVDYQSVPFSDIFTKYKTLIAGNAAPDVMSMNYDNSYTFASLGALEPLDEYIAKSGLDTSTIFASALNMFKVNGVQYSMPATFSDVVLFYNKNLFDAAGLEYPQRDWTQEEFQAAAKALTADTNGDGKIDQWGYSFPWWPIVFEMYNATLWNVDRTTCTMNSPEGIKAIQSIVDGRYVSKYAMTTEDLAVQGDWDTFEAGKLAMLPTGPWAVGTFNEKITSFTYDIAHMPAGDRQATHLYANSYAMSAASKNKDAAWKFIEFATGPEGTKIRQDGKYEISPVKEIAEKYYLASLAGAPPEHASVFLEAMDYAVPQPVHEKWNEIYDAIQPEIDLALVRSESVEDALNNACQGMNAVLNP